MNTQRPTGNTSPKRRRNRNNNGGNNGSELYAALDLGTNSCRMLIAKPAENGLAIVDAFSRSVQLGQELEKTGRISTRGMARTLQALNICAGKLRRHNVGSMRLVATEACRRAKNGREFMHRIRQETGLKLEIIKPAEEARLALLSCAPLVVNEARKVLVIDIGGGSTELIWISLENVDPAKRHLALFELRPSAEIREVVAKNGARIVDWVSVPLGVATLLQKFSDVDDDEARYSLMACAFEDELAGFLPYDDTEIGGLDGLMMIGTSGTVTTLGAIHLNLPRYDRSLVDGMWLGREDIDKVVRNLLELGPIGRVTAPEIGRDRSELIMSGSAILQTIMRMWPAKNIRVADRGLREGILFSLMRRDGVLKMADNQ